MNIKSGQIENFKEYSQFKSLEEFNHHIEMWMVEQKDQFSKSELIGLKRLIRFSAKIPGVCNAKIGTILKAIHEEYNGEGISRSTFKRMILKAKSLGIITVYETERKNGSQTSNLYQFNRYPISLQQDEPAKNEKLDQPKETINLLKTKNKNINKRIDAQLDYTFTDEKVPSTFVRLVRTFFNDAKTIEEYWKMTNIAAYHNNLEDKQEMVLPLATLSFRQMIGKLKKDRVRNPFAYFYGIMNKKCLELYFEELDMKGFTPHQGYDNDFWEIPSRKADHSYS